MNVILAKTAGFCFGVKRAVNMVYEQADKGGRVYTYGPIIHNENVVEDLRRRGVSVIESKEQLDTIHEGVVVIRSHGIDRDTYEYIKQKGLTIADATCPFVKKIHRIVEYNRYACD